MVVRLLEETRQARKGFPLFEGLSNVTQRVTMSFSCCESLLRSVGRTGFSIEKYRTCLILF